MKCYGGIPTLFKRTPSDFTYNLTRTHVLYVSSNDSLYSVPQLLQYFCEASTSCPMLKNIHRSKCGSNNDL